MKKLSVIFIALLVTGYSYAAGNSKLYLGGGLGLNSVGSLAFSDGLGYQVFAGFDLPVKMGKGKLSIEAGYMDSGDIDFGPFFVNKVRYKGLWGNAVFSLPLQKKLNLIARAGLDIGDDDGLMIGAGLGFTINNKMEIRGEYVMRDIVDSLQVNFVMRM